MTNQISGIPLSTVEAKIFAYFCHDDYTKPENERNLCLFWSLDVEAIMKTEHEGITYGDAMRFYHETITFPPDMRHWFMLISQIVEWTDPYDAGIDGSRPAFCMQSHIDIEVGEIKFIECSEDKIRLTWKGWIEGFKEFSIDTWGTFEGVRISRRVVNEEDVRDVLSRYLDVDDFQEEPEVTQFEYCFKPKIAK